MVSGNTIAWYVDTGTTLTLKNTVDYGMSVAGISENAKSDSYYVYTQSGNPAYIRKIWGNKPYLVSGVANASASVGATFDLNYGKFYTPGSTLYPGTQYYVNASGVLSPDGV